MAANTWIGKEEVETNGSLRRNVLLIDTCYGVWLGVVEADVVASFVGRIEGDASMITVRVLVALLPRCDGVGGGRISDGNRLDGEN